MPSSSFKMAPLIASLVCGAAMSNKILVRMIDSLSCRERWSNLTWQCDKCFYFSKNVPRRNSGSCLFELPNFTLRGVGTPTTRAMSFSSDAFCRRQSITDSCDNCCDNNFVCQHQQQTPGAQLTCSKSREDLHLISRIKLLWQVCGLLQICFPCVSHILVLMALYITRYGWAEKAQSRR